MFRIRIVLPLLLLGFLAACDESPTEPAPQVGQLLTLNTNSAENCSSPQNRTGRVVAVTRRAVVVADQQNPAGGFTDAEYEAFGRRFDELVYPVVTAAFGEPGDIDRNQRVLLFFTSAVNALTEGTTSYVGGFFYSRDLFPRTASGQLGACPSSNVSEMFYMRVPEPGRANFSKDQVARGTLGVIGHEFQHLISASRRLNELRFDSETWNEELWLNEGLSHIAEELLFYAESGLTPRQNIGIQTLRSSQRNVDAFNGFASDNFGRLQGHLLDPEGTSPILSDQDDRQNLAMRGAIWSFLRYAADQRSGDQNALWRSFIETRAIGMANLRTSLGTEPIPLLRRWSTANYTDDAVAGAEARYTHPSWMYRPLYEELRTDDRYPLRTYVLSSGAPVSPLLRGGGSAYLRFAVAPALQATLDVTVGTPPGPCQNVSLSVGQVFEAPAGPSTRLCVAGGATGGEFTAVLFHGAESTGTLQVEAVASGILPAVAGPPSPSLSPAFGLDADLGPARRALGFELDLRQRERDLAALVPSGGARRSAAPAARGPADLMVTLVRTK